MRSFTNNYLKLRKNRQEAEEEEAERLEDELAPSSSFNMNFSSVDIAPTPTVSKEDEDEDEDRTWFDSGAFSDGYQFGDVTKTVLGTVGDVAVNVATGILGMGEKVVDAGATLIGFLGVPGGPPQISPEDLKKKRGIPTIDPNAGKYPSQKKVYEDPNAEYIKAIADFKQSVSDFVAEDLYDEEAVAKTILLTDPIKNLTGIDPDEDSVFGEKVDSLAQSGGQLLGTAALQAVGVPWWLTSGATAFGSEAESALRKDATLEEAVVSAAISAGAEILTEKIGGIRFGGKTLGDVGAKMLSDRIASKFWKFVVNTGVGAVGEGIEEWVTEDISTFGRWLTYQNKEDLNELLWSEEAMDAKIEAFLGGAVLGGGSNVTSAVSNVIHGKDAVTGLKKDTEQKVVEREVEARIAEEEKGGKKLTVKEKSKIYDEVLNDLDKGYISTNTIEEVLGGDDYKAYKDTVDSEDSLIKELDELRNMKSGDMTDIQKDRLTELKGMNLTDTSKRDGLKTTLSNNVLGLVKDTKLAESYNERTRRSQAFVADLSEYEPEQAAIVQKAIDSGILNNTNRTHEFVDMVAKISADKGVLFDFANNEKLKASGFAIDGATINGFVTKDGVTINIQAAKSLNKVVGHEITHVLEGTELYGELQNIITEYAKSKGDYQGRYDTLAELYKGVKDANIEAELTADLVGDYLFTDQDFVMSISTKHRNVFQKIYDEIKYLYKVATAGSKEARELERVKKAFDKAYKESGKAEGTKYSISEADQQAFDERRRAALETFGTTYEYDLAGFVLPDGRMLKLGAKWLGVNHSKIEQVYDDVKGYDSVTKFINEGNVRIKASSPGVEISADAPVTISQLNMIGRFASSALRSKGCFYLDITDANGNEVATKTYYDDSSVEDITWDIKKYYRDGEIPKNDDYRYSLSEYTAEEKKAHNDAVMNHFGKTYSWAETGYLLLDGTRLDMSGKHDGAPGGYRTVDHRDITEALGYDYGGGDYSGSLIQFMSEGNIRIIPECNGINLSVMPTKAQEEALSNYISRHRGEVMLDIDDLNGNTVVSVEYPYGTRFTKVLNDIREWFENGKKPENAGNYSLTKNGEVSDNRGWNIRGEDVALAPTQENIAPVEDTAAEVAPVDNAVDETVTPLDYSVDEAPSMREIYGEEYAPVENAYTVEQEIESVQAEMREVYEEYNRLTEEGKEAEAQPLFDKFIELAAKGQDLSDKLKTITAEDRSYLDSLTDADAPPEVEAPYSESGIIDPFEERDMKAVSKDRKAPAYMYENPEVKPFFQEEAERLLGEYERGSKAESFYNGWIKQDMSYDAAQDIPDVYRVGRNMSPSIVYLRDTVGMSYSDIEKGLKAIIEDNGAENIAAAKKIEFELNNRLMYGYQDDSGYDVPANQDYRNLIKEKGVTAYNEEAKKAFFDSLKQIEPTEDIAPIAPETYDAASEKQIAGQQTIFEPAPTESAKTEEKTAEPTEESKVAEVLPSTPKKPKKTSLWQKIRNLVFDKQSTIEDISLKTHNRSLMAKADFMLRSESRAQRHIKKKLLPILEKVEKTGNRQAYEEYAYHLHNIDRMSLEGNAQARIKELEGKFGHLKPEQIRAIAATKITDKTTERTANTVREAKEWLDLLEVKNKPVFGDTVTADVSREAVKKFEATHKDAREISEAITEYNNELRQMMVDAGIISKETADLWAKMYPHYVPIKRADKNGAAVKVPLDSMRTGINAPIARATGGNSDIESLLDTMASRTEQVYRAIARNSFGLELMHSLDTVVETEPTSIDEILESFENKTEELLKAGENGANPTFTVFEDGKRITFDITEELYDALKPTNEALKTEVPIFSFLTKLQRGLLTQYNPTFVATNAIKDIQDVLVNSQHVGKTYANVPAAIKELLSGKGKWITEYMDNGGDDLTMFDSKKQVFKKDSTLKKVLGFAPNFIAKMNDFVEKTPRLAEYIASRKSGASIEVAMLDAARVTTNFAAGGDLAKFANKNGFTFLNASIQGFNQQVRNVREAKANGLKGCMQLAAKFAIAGLPVMLFNALRWEDDEDYAELSDYVKDNYYIVAKYGDGKFVRIPKGRAVAVIQNAFEQMKNLITGDDEVDMERFGELLVTNLAPNDPLENNVIAPIIQAANNKTWYGEELVPTRLQDLPDAEQYDETTDAISKWLGENVGGSPYKWNYLIDQYSGGVGDVVLPMLTPESDGDGVIAPWADKFTTDSVMKNQNVSDFYTKVDELTKNANSMHATDEDILKSKYINSISSELGELYAQKREIQNNIVPEDERYDDIRDLYKDKKIPDKVKDELVRDVQKQIVELTKTGLSSYGDIQYEGDGEYAIIGDRYYQWYTPKTGDAYWRKLDEDQVVKYNLTKNAEGLHYVTNGNVHYRLDEEGEWTKISDRQLERQNEVTKALGITPEEYWSKTDISFLPLSDGEYEYAFENPEKYTIAKAVGGYDAYKTYSSELYNIKADKDANGKSISGSRKEKVIEYINNLDADYGTKIILFKSEYNADDTYNNDIIDYLNSRDDISFKEMKTILEELGFTVDSRGNISWD